MGLEWVEADSFHLPELPRELQIDPILASLLHMACFMEFSGEKTVDFDESLSALESMAYYLQRMSTHQKSEVDSQIKRVVEYAESQGWKPEVAEFISKFLEHAGIENE